MKLTLKVNGTKRRVDVPPMKRLLDTLREDLRLTGTKEGCGEGECGACTVLVGGEAVNSCLLPTCQAEGVKIETVEGLGAGERLNKLQRAFLECGAAQCGICTPGMLMAASALPKRPTLEQIREGLAGNLCRCTGYMKIYDAVARALGSPDVEAKAKPKRPTAKAAKRAAKQAAKASREKRGGKREARA